MLTLVSIFFHRTNELINFNQNKKIHKNIFSASNTKHKHSVYIINRFSRSRFTCVKAKVKIIFITSKKGAALSSCFDKTWFSMVNSQCKFSILHVSKCIKPKEKSRASAKIAIFFKKERHMLSLSNHLIPGSTLRLP